mmetsp:Transcript_11050/g.31257  ORF Transcript_11050/g.31257 Transcript_11050/m.31257 type:complete len:349 (+) Transcript_11050:236-1282(+)
MRRGSVHPAIGPVMHPEHLTIADDLRVLHARLPRQLRVGTQEGILTMHRQEVLRLDELDHLIQFITVSVARGVQQLAPSHGDVHTPLGDVIHHLHHPRVVPWDDLGAIDKQVRILELQAVAGIHRGEVQGGARLPLRARGDNEELVGVHVVNLGERDDLAWIDRGPSLTLGSLKVGGEAHANERNLAARGLRSLLDTLHPVQVGGKLGADHTALPLVGQHPLHDSLLDLALADGPPRAEDVGGVTHHQRHTFLPNLLPCVPVKGFAVDGVLIDLPVAGVHNVAVVAAQDEAAAVRDGVRHADRLTLEWAKWEPVTHVEGAEAALLPQVELHQAPLDEGHGKARGVDWG